jgi:hypothetical protein
MSDCFTVRPSDDSEAEADIEYDGAQCADASSGDGVPDSDDHDAVSVLASPALAAAAAAVRKVAIRRRACTLALRP